MVMFTCNECGAAVKKNAVENHHMRNRSCQSLSCMDCGKEFLKNEYKNHTKCISEHEKYGGKTYKPSINKGEVKQELWINHARNAITSEKVSGPLKHLLEQIIEYPNIPRKQKKFENFLKSSLRMHNRKLIGEAWAVMNQGENVKPVNNNRNGDSKSTELQNKNSNEISRKASPNSPNKVNKRPHEEELELSPVKQMCGDNQEVSQGSPSKRFQWCKLVAKTLAEAPDRTLPLSKLRKKVFSEYAAFVGDSSARSKAQVKTRLKALLKNSKQFNMHKL